MICPFILSLVPRILSPVSSPLTRLFDQFLAGEQVSPNTEPVEQQNRRCRRTSSSRGLEGSFWRSNTDISAWNMFFVALIVNSSTIPPLPQSLLFKTQPYFKTLLRTPSTSFQVFWAWLAAPLTLSFRLISCRQTSPSKHWTWATQRSAMQEQKLLLRPWR